MRLHRQTDLRMAKNLLNHLGMNALRQQHRRASVSEVVDSHVSQFRLRRVQHSLSICSLVHGLRRADFRLPVFTGFANEMSLLGAGDARNLQSAPVGG
jgi:hypothetical protein